MKDDYGPHHDRPADEQASWQVCRDGLAVLAREPHRQRVVKQRVSIARKAATMKAASYTS